MKDKACYFLDKLHFFKMLLYKDGTKSSCNLIKCQFHTAIIQIKVACTSLHSL
jgi:hypothetical protein